MSMRSILVVVAVSLLLIGFGDFTTAQFVQQAGPISASDNSGAPSQGKSVYLSADGNTAIVGGYTDNGTVGAAWIYTRSGSSWSQQGSKLVGSGASTPARQGVAVALSADGNTAIVGGYVDNTNVGAAWIFKRSGGVWSQDGGKLVGSGYIGSPLQGISVAISGDGLTAMLGGQFDNSNAGAAWVFMRTDSGWNQQGNKLVGTGATGAAMQGQSVALSFDGNTAAVGATNDNSAVGAVWIFTRSGVTWTQQGSKLVASDYTGGAVQGASVSLSSDGNTLLVGGHYDNSNAGAAWIYQRTGSSWNQQGGKLVGSGASGQARQGRCVSISSDGSIATIGGPADNFQYGATWVFKKSGTSWTQLGRKLVGTGGFANGIQGEAVAISGDGSTILAGGEGLNAGAGAVWFFIAGPSVGLEGSWSFDEASGSIVYDSSGNGNNGTAYGTTIVPGHAGNARSFNGVGDYIVVPNPADGAFDFNEHESFTVTVWFNTNGEQGHLLRRGLSPAPGFMMGISYGKVVAIVGDYDGVGPTDTLIIITTDMAYNDGTWHKATFVRDREREKMYLYIDEVQATAPVNDPFALPLVSDRPLTFGRWENPDFPGYFQGSLDEITISRSANHPPGAQAPIIQVVPQSINFGRVLSGASSSRPLLLRNVGIHDSLNVTGITSTNPLFSPSATLANIPSGTEDAINIMYGPTSVHADTATLMISSNDPSKPVVYVNLSGEGYEPTDEPIITAVSDIPNDNGHQVRVVWSRSVFDGLNDSLRAVEYNLWRRVDQSPRALGASGIQDGKIFSLGGHSYVSTDGQLWDYIARVPAVNFNEYAYVAPTLADSRPQSPIPWSVFKVSVHMASGEFLFSSADSGYSVDELSPSPPTNITVSQHADVLNLRWDAPAETDVSYYSVYAGTVQNFIPDLTSLVGKSKDNSFDYLNSTGASTLYFRVTAVDNAGNQSHYSTEASNSITGLKEGNVLPTAFRLYQNYPNPFNPSATIKYDVAKEELVVLKVYNIIGQEVATLANQKMQPGSYVATWKALNAPTGLYMVRMIAGSYTSVKKMLLVR